jgi:uncharacterized membrane protein YqjE
VRLILTAVLNTLIVKIPTADLNVRVRPDSRVTRTFVSISTNVAKTGTTVTRMRYARTRMDRSIALAKPDTLAMGFTAKILMSVLQTTIVMKWPHAQIRQAPLTVCVMMDIAAVGFNAMI